MNFSRYSKEYIDGIESFLHFAYSYGDPHGEKIQCPCAKCRNILWNRRNVVYDHLICHGFVKGYTRWINHGEWDIKLNVDDDMDYSCDDIDGLLNDQFRDVAQAGGVYDGPNEDAKKFYSLLEETQKAIMCSKTADSLRWHEEERSKDGKLRHPADGLAWKDFDRVNQDFAQDCRNVRLGLSSDGFNPFRTMNELKLLWVSGVETYDASRNETFQMRAALMWTISDFPAYAMLSCWSTKGKFACPCCNYGTNSRYLKHSPKMCYMDHRVFLPMDHPWRSNKRSFNGKIEFRPPPAPLKGIDVLNSLRDFENVFGKKKKRSNDGPWKKRSIFFELPYWQHNLLHHNLDVTPIEKNIVDSILGTLLDISGKTKDHAKALYDLKDMGMEEPSSTRYRR
ncbi:uncharacterized protein LOC107013359 [Solanum pennellii]|uniref:Uncharacterized protein LOC107013359 n=1 Tax=Solanum pennellii TaxID=28526 RepID=A0ABM1GBP7_SOLPN|nr:uncharacterized protein LOC107013359 [Solanum pennellii]